MEKRKVYKISIIDKEISRTEFDRNTFYTSDSELSLVFKLIEKDYSYEHGEILLFNENDKSFVTREITKIDNDFVYELDLDIIPHFGKWRAQLQLVNDGDVYTSKPFDFIIENDLSNLSPQPTLTDINNWSTLKQSANELIDEMQDIIVSIKQVELERVNKENYRQQAESERISKENTRQNSELIRENQETKRNKSESERYNNEKQRRIAEFERVDKESKRQSTFETNESERQKTFETAEQERVSAELIRVENENQRNLTSVDEFIKLQNAFGGRNLVLDTSDTEFTEITIKHSTYLEPYNTKLKVEKDATYAISLFVGDLPVPTLIEIGTGNQYGYLTHSQTAPINLKPNQINTFVVTFSSTISSYRALYLRFRSNQADNTVVRFNKLKVTKGSMVYPYTKAPEDYTSVSKDDYYNHIELVNNAKNNQFNQLKQAVIALGGTV